MCGVRQRHDVGSEPRTGTHIASAHQDLPLLFVNSNTSYSLMSVSDSNVHLEALHHKHIALAGRMVIRNHYS